jgi:transposase-like protein
MKTAKGIVILYIEVDCPHCGQTNDVVHKEHNLFDGNRLPDPVLVHEVFECDHCSKEYLLNELEY